MFKRKDPRRKDSYMARVVEIGCSFADEGRSRYAAKYMQLFNVPESVTRRVIVENIRRTDVPESRIGVIRNSVVASLRSVFTVTPFAALSKKG